MSYRYINFDLAFLPFFGCINRAGKILIPSGQDTIEPGDTVVVVTSVTGLNELDDILDKRRG